MNNSACMTDVSFEAEATIFVLFFLCKCHAELHISTVLWWHTSLAVKMVTATAEQTELEGKEFSHLLPPPLQISKLHC